MAGLSADIDPEHTIWKVPRHAKAMGETVFSTEGWTGDISHNLKMLAWAPQHTELKNDMCPPQGDLGTQICFYVISMMSLSTQIQRYIFVTFQANGPCFRRVQYREGQLKSWSEDEVAHNQLQVFEACFTLFFIGETWWIEPGKNNDLAARRKLEPAKDAEFDPAFDGLFSL